MKVDISPPTSRLAVVVEQAHSSTKQAPNYKQPLFFLSALRCTSFNRTKVDRHYNCQKLTIICAPSTFILSGLGTGIDSVRHPLTLTRINHVRKKAQPKQCLSSQHTSTLTVRHIKRDIARRETGLRRNATVQTYKED
jgi:hypothetical protein